MKTLLILVDGMRPDAIENMPAVQELMKKSTYTLDARTVMPSVTLPCHVSLFHSVDPERHGTTTNVYAPQVRPIKGLCEVLSDHGKKNAFFYDWEQLRDLTRPGSLTFSYFFKGKGLGSDKTIDMVTEAAMECLRNHEIDFAFVYFGYPDAAGHKRGWLSDAYMDAVHKSWENIEKIVAALPEDYVVIVTADHGGSGRDHGKDVPEDMTIPIFIFGKDIEKGKEIFGANIIDIAPTITKLFGVKPDEDWEGKSLI